MTSKRLNLILTIGICLLLIGLVAGTYNIHTVLTTKANALTDAKAKQMALDEERVGLQKAKRDIKTYAGLMQITQAIVPQDKNQAAAVREIVNIAAANGIGLTSITFPASTLGGSGLPSAAASASGSAAASPSSAASASSSKNALSQLTKVKDISGVYNLMITVESDSTQPVPYNKFIGFLSALEHNRRTAQVQTITLQPNTENRNLVSFTLTVNEYIKP